MSRVRTLLLFVAVGIAAAAAGYLFNTHRSGGAGDDPPPAAAAEVLMGARVADLDGNPQDLRQWQGKVLVVNFWATWCAPCRAEIPMFVKLQEQYGAQGLQFVGIAIDQPDKVRAFAREFGMNYPVLIGGLDVMELSRFAGNRLGALPFTLVIGRDGRAGGSHLGEFKERHVNTLILPLLQGGK